MDEGTDRRNSRAPGALRACAVDGVEWYWPPASVHRSAARRSVRLLAPFDPVVHDRARFELLWAGRIGSKRTRLAAQRKRGYYALPLLWRDRVIGWGNVSVKDGALASEIGYVDGRARRAR
jgi:uncharacterized protein YcaQ